MTDTQPREIESKSTGVFFYDCNHRRVFIGGLNDKGLRVDEGKNFK